MAIYTLKSFTFQLLLIKLLCVAANESSLYSDAVDQNIKTLNNNTLEIELFSSPKCKFVQFINYFCGDCRRYVNTFKQMALRLYGWERVLSVYVVDCAQERNVKICRDYDIRSTPTLKIFPPHFQRTEQQIGWRIATLIPDEIYEQLADYISKIKYTTLRQPNFEPMTIENNFLTLLNQGYCDFNGLNHLVLVFEPTNNSTIGRDTILGLLPWQSVAVRIVSDDKLFGSIVDMSTKLAIMDCLGHTRALKPLNESSAAYVDSVNSYLQAAGYYARPTLLTTTPMPNATQDEDLAEEQALIISIVLQARPKVYRADLEQAIDKLLHIELPKMRVFKGDSLRALQQLLNVLRLFSPLNASGKMLLERLHKFVQQIDATAQLTGLAFETQLQLLERMLPKVFKAKRYVGCLGTRPSLRGFTCSLWTLFHYLSVEAAKTNVLPRGAVLTVTHGFVKHFFGCADCVQHFLDMAERRRMSEVSSRDGEILWLWAAHNEVNERLMSDITEDPKFPKIHFPNRNLCPKCQITNSSNWNNSEVLIFLKEFYDNKNLSNYGLPTPIGYD